MSTGATAADPLRSGGRDLHFDPAGRGRPAGPCNGTRRHGRR